MANRQSGRSPGAWALALTVAVVAVSLAPAAAQSPPVLDLARLQDQTLDNGLRVILKSEPYWRAAALTLVLRTGSKDDPPGQEGIAHLVEHLLFEPSEGGETLPLRIEDLGGQLGAATTNDFTRLSVAVPSQFVPELLPELAEMVFAARFTEAQLEREKQVVVQEMSDRYATVSGRLGREVWDLAFARHPYGRPVPGTPESVAEITLEQVQEFYRQHYVPENAALVAVGDLDPTAFFALAREHFGRLPTRPRAPERIEPEPPQTEVRTRVQQVPLTNTVMQFAWHAPGMDNPQDVCALDLIFTALARGETSLLTRVLEDEGRALASEAGFLTQRYPGLFLITVITPPDQELPAREAVRGLLTLLREDLFPLEQLDYLKRLLFADYAFVNQSYRDQAETLAFYEAIDTYRFACTYLDRVHAVTPEQLQATARRYLREDNFSLVILRASGAAGTGAET